MIGDIEGKADKTQAKLDSTNERCVCGVCVLLGVGCDARQAMDNGFKNVTRRFEHPCARTARLQYA